jgi:hypothetical protein
LLLLLAPRSLSKGPRSCRCEASVGENCITSEECIPLALTSAGNSNAKEKVRGEDRDLQQHFSNWGEGKLKCGSAHPSHRSAYARGANVANAHLLVISATSHAIFKDPRKEVRGGATRDRAASKNHTRVLIRAHFKPMSGANAVRKM